MRDILTIVNVRLTFRVFAGLMLSADNKVCFLQSVYPKTPLLGFYSSPPLLGLPPIPKAFGTPKGGLKN